MKLGELMASILKDFEARQLEVDEDEQLELVENKKRIEIRKMNRQTHTLQTLSLSDFFESYTVDSLIQISPFYSDVVIDVKRRVRQGDTICPKLFNPTLENVMRDPE
ncbi:unnamed protein product [Heligmosomoides polygyrus]|uniref:Transposase n=1 Tax=Heligmosomoides polygyrus TaxID=6339 RepID=A0A183F793_HELPZ|nr:unnamed protein product [Heligmosomoides polygyrus]